jgi:hypothetical protein
VPLGAVVAVVGAGLLLFTRRKRMASAVVLAGLLLAAGAWRLTRPPATTIP